MAKRAQFEVPAGMQAAVQRFEEWRSSHSGRRPIPEDLWRLAAEMARQHGVFPTATALRLDYSKLKRQMGLAQPQAEPVSAPPTFLELLSPQAPAICECVIEVEGPRGRMRIEWKGTTVPDLCGLSRGLWEPGA